MKRLVLLFGLVLLLSVAVPAEADIVLYSNGPVNGFVAGWDIGLELSSEFLPVSNSFTLSSRADLESMSLGTWVCCGDGLPSTLSFGISASPFGSDLGSGTETLSNVFLFPGQPVGPFVWNILLSSFTFPSIDLAAGTYYITLFGGTTTGAVDQVLWDQNNGPSLAFNGNGFGGGSPIPSESFSIDGAIVPEPGTLFLLGIGIIFGIAATTTRSVGRTVKGTHLAG